MRAYQDEVKSRNDLSLLEDLNVQCDEKAKSLIINEINKIVPFSFSLSSPFITSVFTQQILNTKDDVLLYISLAQSKEYLQKKLRTSLKLN